jgi:proline iminopeptidase
MMLSRRLVVAGGLALLVAPSSRAAEAGFPRPGHPGRLIEIRGKKLYVEVSGPENAPVVVYIHGGPGSGSYDFGLYQRERLSKHLRLVQFDQRGALRSESIGADEPFTLADLVDDTEALRLALGVKQWFVIGESFGGVISVLYALKYPDAVKGMIFDNPSFDIGASDKSQALEFANVYRQQGKPAEAEEATSFATAPFEGIESFRRFNKIAGGLGLDARLQTFVHSLPHGYFMEWVRQSGLSIADWGKGGEAAAKIWRSGDAFVDLKPRLRELRGPAILIKGRYDTNTSADQVESFRQARLGPVVMFENSAHMTHAEEPDRYAQVVERFILTGKI